MAPQSSDVQAESSAGVLGRVTRVVAAVLLVAIPFVVASLFYGFVAAPIAEAVAGVAPTDAAPPVPSVLNWLALHVFGFGATVALFLHLTGRGRAYVPVDWPMNGADLRLALGAGGVGFAANSAVKWLASAVDFPMATHTTLGDAATDPAIAAVLIAGTLFVVAPAEELLFRGVIQSYVAERFPLAVAIAATSLLFTLPHASAYGDVRAVALLVPLGVTFAMSCVIGWLYARSENFLVPVVTHGVFNALSLLAVVAAA